jgi:hypothetical protein
VQSGRDGSVCIAGTMCSLDDEAMRSKCYGGTRGKEPKFRFFGNS